MRRPSPIVLVLIGIVSVQLGAGIAKSLFDEVSPTAIVWLRLSTSAAILVAYARPHLSRRRTHDWLVVLGFGASLGLMNLAIYQSFARIPLGIAVTIEFIGPLTLAVLGSRRVRDLVWVLLAGVGVGLLGIERADLDPVGVLWALMAGAMWATYILLSGATGRRWEGLDGLAVASAIAAVLLTPVLALTDNAYDDTFGNPHVLLLGAAVGLLSSVVPYSCELIALRRLRAATFGILMSLEPAAAALVGILLLGELLSTLQWLAVLCVIVASIGATRTHASLAEPVPGPA